MTNPTPQPTITVLGAGYVGLTTAVLLAHSGYKVFAIEPNQERLATIQSGRSFFYEDGIDTLIKSAIDDGNLIVTDSYSDSVPFSSVVFSCVGTPDNPDGSSNLTYVFSAAEESAKLMQPTTVYVQKSTVPVGTGTKVLEIFNKTDKSLSYVSNPEFLREGTAIYDTLYFDRVVAGGDNPKSVETVLNIYKQLEENREAIAKRAEISPNPRLGKYISTSLNSAELIKVTSNAFLALKISFANSIAKLSDAVGADIVEVMDAVGADERIGRSFLNAGRGYGGGCFPKDVSGLISSGLEHGVDLEIMTAAQAVNHSMPGYILEKIQSHGGITLENKRVAVLGLAFKSGTSDTRKSPGIAIANQLSKIGSSVTAFDPRANGEARNDLSDDVTVVDTLEGALESAEMVIVATEWPEFKNITPQILAKYPQILTVVDGINGLDKHSYTSSNIQYLAIGR